MTVAGHHLQEDEWEAVDVPLSRWLQEAFPGELLRLDITTISVEAADEELRLRW